MWGIVVRSSRLRRHGVTLTRKREEEALRHFRCGKLELGKGGGRGAGAWPLIWGGVISIRDQGHNLFGIICFFEKSFSYHFTKSNIHIMWFILDNIVGIISINQESIFTRIALRTVNI